MEHGKLQKMLEILIMLSGPFGRKKEGLAEHFSINLRTINRYFTTFRNAGFVLEEENAYWHINKEESQYKDLSHLLNFSQEESLILRNAINSVNAPAAIIDELTSKLYSLYNFDRVATPLLKSDNEKKIFNLEDAIKNKKQVWLYNYQSANSDSTKDRLVEAFDFSHNFRSVWAFDSNSNVNKLFVLSRFTKVEILKTNWKNEGLHEKMKMDIFRMTGTKRIMTVIRLTNRAKNLLIEEYPLSEQYLEFSEKYGFVLRTEVYSLEGIARFVRGLIDEIEIIEPKVLKQKIVQDFRSYLKK